MVGYVRTEDAVGLWMVLNQQYRSLAHAAKLAHSSQCPLGDFGYGQVVAVGYGVEYEQACVYLAQHVEHGWLHIGAARESEVNQRKAHLTTYDVGNGHARTRRRCSVND